MEDTSNIQQKIPVSIQDELRTSYLDYAMSVIIGRAIPDVRDGLKPVHRRILFSMNEQKIGPSGAHKKCARVVGDVLGKYHPHGDVGRLRRARPHGADLQPALPAHRRAGQLRLDRRRFAGRHALHRVAASPASSTELLADIDKETVDFTPNYDDTELEPTRPAGEVPAAPRQRLGRHRRRHGDQHPAAQPRRDHRRDHRAHREPRDHHRRADAASSPAPTSRRAASSTARAASTRPTAPAAARSCMRGTLHRREDAARAIASRSSSPRSPTR